MAHHHHDHSHVHDHSAHSHAPDDFGRAFAVGAILNSAFVVAELFFGYAANSLALISDAVHNLSDVAALLLAWGAAWLAGRRPTDKHTYGYRRASILAALFNAGLLLMAVGGIAVEAVNRLREPAAVAGWTVVWVAAVGVVINGATALLFMRGRHGDPNIRGAYLHMAADASVSLGVVVAALLIMATGWLWLDPVISLGISAVVLAGSWGLARDHDLHIWAMSTNETALTVHLVRPAGHDDAFLHHVCAELAHRFNIHHATLQVEANGEACRLAPAEMV